MNKLAPIALFIYKRPDHLREVLVALERNIEFPSSQLFVFCDGAKKNSEEAEVEKTRQVVREFNWPNATVIEASENRGLARSIISGVSRLCTDFGRVIVLEDDIVVSPFFLNYMNRALATYREIDRVMHISGYRYPVHLKNQPETFFFRQEACWGWATWQRAWKHFEPDTNKLLDAITEKGLRRELDIDGTYPFYRMLKKQASGAVDSWAIRWSASLCLNGGLSLYPFESLTRNIGLDGTGVHSPITSQYNVKILERPIGAFNMQIEESADYLEGMKIFNRKLTRITPARVINKLKKEVKRIFT